MPLSSSAEVSTVVTLRKQEGTHPHFLMSSRHSSITPGVCRKIPRFRKPCIVCFQRVGARVRVKGKKKKAAKQSGGEGKGGRGAGRGSSQHQQIAQGVGKSSMSIDQSATRSQQHLVLAELKGYRGSCESRAGGLLGTTVNESQVGPE